MIAAVVVLALLAVGVYVLRQRAEPVAMLTVTPSATARPGEQPATGKVVPTAVSSPMAAFPPVPPTVVQRPAPERAERDFAALFAVSPPVHDYFDTAEALARADYGERTVDGPTDALGDRRTFFTNDGPRPAELVYEDELATYWVEVGLAVDRTALAAAAERLRNEYYPLLARSFGQEWRPGIDGDPRFAVLHVLGAPDTYELGYFVDENQYPRALFDRSNEREMIYLNMAQLDQGALYDGTLVHEVQHMIQWNLDANEDKWLNEGLAQVAETLVGLDTIDPHAYMERTDVRLDRWTEQAPDIHAHYAGSYLYLLYFWEQLGDAALSELARHPANGLAAVRAVLAGHRPELSLEQFTADWATALLLDGAAADARYQIDGATLAPPFFANRVRRLPFDAVTAMEQYAIDYIDLDFSGWATVTFAGDSAVGLLPPPPDGETVWYAPPANSARSQLTAEVDLRGMAHATLEFDVWHDLEPAYDFAYLSASTDGGQTWRPLRSDSSLLGAYGPAWGGRSGDTGAEEPAWRRESVSLNGYTGRTVLLRFDVVTDFEVSGRGFAVAGPVVPQLAKQPAWEPAGFVETGPTLPQRWEVRLIREGRTPEVIPMALDGLNRGRLDVELGPDGGVLVVTPLTPFVESEANYWLSVTR